MKQLALSALRALGLIEVADRIRFALSRRRSVAGNREFIAAHPGLPLPPAHLSYDAYGHADWNTYLESGSRHASFFAGLVRSHATLGRPVRICEWGCGPARIIRHLPTLLQDLKPEISGSDYNPESIAWCKASIPDVTFLLNNLEPPIPVQDGAFSFVYCLSVFTHLSEPMHRAWMAELIRILEPGGILVITTHGDLFTGKLLAGERRLYAQGGLVVRDRAMEGKRCFTAFQPPAYVRGSLAKGLEERQYLGGDEQAGLQQDIWVFRKPVSAAG